MNIMINYWAVIGAAVSMMIVGSFWYGPLFGKMWMKAAGVSRGEKGSVSMPAAVGLMFVSSLVLTYVLAHAIVLVGAQTAGDVAQLAFWVWLGFVVPTFISLSLFERRSWKLYFLTVGQYLVALEIAGLILSHWA